MAVATVMGGGPDIVGQTRYHAATGQVVETRQPAAAGTTASPGTTRTTYYTAGAHNPAACTSSAWYGLACKVEPGAQPGVAGLPQLPVETYSYDTFLRPTVVTETVVDAGGTTRTRTTTTTFENAGNGPRQVRSEVTGGLGTAVPATTTAYDPATGLPTTTATATTPAVEIRTLYDEFGRTRSVTDADGATTDTTYNATSGRINTTTWKDPAGAVLGSQTFGYDGGTEHRGLTTALTDTAVSGQLTAGYDADGTLATQTMPNGITATNTIDPTGDVTKVAYAKGSFWFEDRQDSNIHGQWRWHVGPAGWEAHGYDPAGRLAVVWDQRNGQPPCVQRAYTLDPNSNRTALRTWPADGNCPPATTPATTSYSYDTADRLQPTGIAAGLTYDAFGRTTTLPAALAGGTTTSIGYHTTDMIATQTQGGITRSWTLDPAGRLRTAAKTGEATKVNHYDDTGDSPAWIDEGDGTRVSQGPHHLCPFAL
jgi:YD repeat-containing protein